jgi:hypothetical protein
MYRRISSWIVFVPVFVRDGLADEQKSQARFYHSASQTSLRSWFR